MNTNNTDVRVTNLKPDFYFKYVDFFEILQDREVKNISAKYVKNKNGRFVYFYQGSQQLGYLKLTKRNIV